MRSFFLCPLLVLAGLLPATAAEARHIDDATLRAVHFVDDREGWAVGDDCVIWHTMDGGKNWERQGPSGVQASLRSIHFVNTCVGWIAGIEQLPGGGSAGVVLYTNDAGVNWKRVMVNSCSGLHLVRFVDEQTGYLAGDGSEQYPSGLFATTNGGRTWEPIPGRRSPSWRAGDFNREGGALAGAWNRLATVRRAQMFSVKMDSLGGRNLCGLQLRGDGGVAVGQGGLVLLSSKSRGSSWYFAEMNLPREVQDTWDFHAVHGAGAHVWAVGRPGSAALHSPDGGKTWEVVRTGQTMPLYGIFFHDEKKGWAVGGLGASVATNDGGKTWQVQHRGGEHAAVLSIHARPAGIPLDTAALLGEQDGYLTANLVVAAPESTSADLGRSGAEFRTNEAYRQAGGAVSESLWQFPIASHLTHTDRDMLIASWNKLHGGRAPEEFLRQVVLAIRAYRPEVILTDCLESDNCADALTAEAVKAACVQAGDRAVFPEQLTTLGLRPHTPRKLYGVCGAKTGAQVTYDLTQVSAALGSTVREFAAAPAALLGQDNPPATRHYKLLASQMDGAESHHELLQGIVLPPGGPCRRVIVPARELSAEAIQSIRARANLWAIAEAPATELTSPERLLAQIGPALSGMPEDAGARVMHGLANLYAGKGQWALARETHLLLVERYPIHPLAVQSYRWLLLHQGSSEARRRHELGQFMVVEQLSGGVPGESQPPISIPAPTAVKDKKVERKLESVPTFGTKRETTLSYLGNRDEVRRWYQGCVAMAKKLSALGPMYSRDPAIQFCVQAARRQLGDVQPALRWYRDFVSTAPDGPWKTCALAELWLNNRTGSPPRPVLTCAATDSRPYLDGKLDDPCWTSAHPVRLQSAAGETASSHPTEVRLAHDLDFLYIAVRCGRPASESKPAAGARTRDKDLRRNDRVSILLDLDRDYSTCFHLQVDETGCVLEDCWGDRSWDPRWFVAIHRDESAWTAEIAIPRNALTGNLLTVGQAWAGNIIRVLPGKGVQALSLPAEAPEVALRPEGLGLILFTQDAQQAAARPANPPR
jgi:photosystem II stability/assembly factor-like uncharacterized protein